MVSGVCEIKNGDEWIQGVVMGFVRGGIERVDQYYAHHSWPVTFAIVCIQDKLIEVTLDQVRML